MITGAVPVPVAPMTLSAGLRAVTIKLTLTQIQGQALSFKITRCHRVGATVVCSFQMLMRGGVTCTGRVQVRNDTDGVYGRYIGPRRHPKHVVCK